MAEVATPQTRPPKGIRIARGTPLARLQAKLEVGPSGDRFEREADAVASQVMRGGEAAMAIPPSITPLGAQRKTVPGPRDEDISGAGKPKSAQRKPAPAKEEEKAARGRTAQRKAAPAAGHLQRDAAAGAAGGIAAAPVSAAIAAMQSGSAPGLDRATRGFMEGRFGRDLGQVRVHSGPRAAAAADALGARAFTVGRDIFFAAGQYRPQASTGRQLLAHELTHTVQQGGTGRVAARSRVQRMTEDDQAKSQANANAATGSDAGTAAPTVYDVPGFKGASIDIRDVGGQSRGTITLPVLALPQIAQALKGTEGGLNTPAAAKGRMLPQMGKAFQLAAPLPKREDSIAAETWTAGVRTELKKGVGDKLSAMQSAATDAAYVVENEKRVYYLTFKGTTSAHADNLFIGTLEELADSDALLRPQWTPNGRPLSARDERLDADHFLEAQLGGADSAANMWLLQSSYNRSVGSTIANNIARDVKAVVKAASSLPLPEGEAPTEAAIAPNWTLNFSSVAAGSGFARATTIYWTRAQIGQGAHLDHLRFMTNADLVARNIRLGSNQRPPAIDVYPGMNGGRRASFALTGNTLKPPTFFYYGLKVNTATYEGDAGLGEADKPLMKLNLTAFRTREGKEYLASRTVDVPVKRAPRLGIAGYLDPVAIRGGFAKTDFPGLSPLVFADMGISAEGMLTGSGSVGSSKAMLPGLQVPLFLEGESIVMRFAVPVDRLSLGPLSVTEASLGLGYGPSGLFLEGYAGIAVNSLGSGSLIAQITEAGPRLSGLFNLDTDFLEPASIAATYDLATDALSASATLGVGQGKVPGVESGTVTVGISRDAATVNGTINLGGPLRGTVVNVTYNQTDGLRIGASNIPLPFANLPAVQNATLSVSASRPPNADGWSFAGTGSATLAVPGATGTLAIDYIDGAVTIHGTGQVARGPATGTLDFTATNRPIDAQGTPVEGPLTDGLTVWGRGTVTVAFGKLLTGTAGIELTPDNRVIITGTIAMPPVYEVFARRDYTKDIFTLSPPEFPIWGVSVAGVGVGVFAFVDARVFFEAFVGPGQIRDAAVTATLDLDRPEDATVQGQGEFHVPAYAGLGLDVGGGLRARLAVAYAQGRVGLTGRLGVEAGAGATVDFDWSRATGLSLGVDLHAKAQPKFDLSATASVSVGVDLVVKTLEKTWGPWAKQLGSFGPDMTLGVSMPVRWSESAGLDLSLDNIVVTRPTLDASALMTDVFDRLAG